MDPNNEPIATPSIFLYKVSLKMKFGFLVAKDNNSLNTDLFKPLIISFWSYINYVQMLMISSSGMLAKSEPLSKLPI